jgi:hypothetical protein
MDFETIDQLGPMERRERTCSLAGGVTTVYRYLLDSYLYLSERQWLPPLPQPCFQLDGNADVGTDWC